MFMPCPSAGRRAHPCARVTLKQQLTKRILDLHAVDQRPSRFADKPAFFVGRREIAHFHGNNAIDLRLTRARIGALKAELQEDSRVELRPSASDWVEFTFRRKQDLDRAVELVELAVEANR